MSAQNIITAIFLILLTGFAEAKKAEVKASSKTKQVTTKTTQLSPKWHKLNNLINEEIKTINSLGRLGSRLKFRLLELYSEQIKLIKEKENLYFLSIAPAISAKKGKRSYFKESRNLYLKAKKHGLKIIKDYPHFKFKADVYYTLALNSRDYGGDKETEYFLHKSLRHSSRNAPITHNIKTSLAEYYYNQKKYKKAINYYNDVLENKSDEWYSKHLYNASWCYFKSRQYNKSIELQKISYEYSKHKRYADVSDQVLESIGLFHIYGKRIKEGVQFYLESLIAPGEHLIKMAKQASEKATFDETRYILISALKNAKAKKQWEQQVIIRLAELEIYRSLKRLDLFFNSSQALVELNKEKLFKLEHRDDAITKIKSLVGYLQVRLTKNLKVSSESYDSKKLNRVIQYFDILANLAPEEIDSYHFYQGETYFAVWKNKSAAQKYKSALEHSKRLTTDEMLKKMVQIHNQRIKENSQNDQVNLGDIPGQNKKKEEKPDPKRLKLKRKIVNSLLATIERESFGKNEQNEWTIYAYTNHIEIWPIDKKSREIYKRLFNLYLEIKRVPEALITLKTYLKNYPKDIEIQRPMLVQVIDFHIKAKNTDRLAFWVSEIEKGYLSFDKKYIEKATGILGKILFEKYQKVDQAGKKKEAADGYISLYENEKYPRQVKAKSAFNASILFLEVGQTETAWKWIKLAFKHYIDKELFPLASQIDVIGDRFFLQQEFRKSASLSRAYLKRFCKKKFKAKNKLYQKMVQFHVVEERWDDFYRDLKISQECQIPPKYQQEANQYALSSMIRNRQNKLLSDFLSRYPKDKSYHQQVGQYLMDSYWHYKLGQHKEESQIYYKWVSKNLASPLADPKLVTYWRDLKVFRSFEKVSQVPLFRPFVDKAPFKEEIFNKTLEYNLAKLQEYTQQAKKMIKKGHPEVVLGSYFYLKNHYKTLGDMIASVHPQGMPTEYVKGFKAQMKSLAHNMHKESKQFYRLGYNLVQKNNLKTEFASKFKAEDEVLELLGYRYPASQFAVTLDSQGGIK